MDAVAFLSLGNSLMGQRRLAEAEAAYRQALQLNPRYAEVHLNLGVCLKQQARIGEAEASYRDALSAQADFVEAHNNLANILRAQGRLPEAEAGYRLALALRPGHLEALINLSSVLSELGQTVEAEALAHQAVTLRPERPEAHQSLGKVLRSSDRLGEAEAAYRRALQLRPDDAESLNILGNVLQAQHRHAEAETCYRHALSIRPSYAEAANNLGNALQELGRHDESDPCYRQALQLRPAYPEALCHLGSSLKARNRLPEAAACFRQALDLRPDYGTALNNLAQTLITQNDAPSALPLILRSLQAGETPQNRMLFIDCIKRFRISHVEVAIYDTLTRALGEPWGQANLLARVAAEMIRIKLRIPGFEALHPDTDANQASNEISFGPQQLAAAATDELLRGLLLAAPIRDAELERYLTLARRFVLNHAAGAGSADRLLAPVTPFLAALATQCFINEYVFALAPDEAQSVTALAAAVDATLSAGTQPEAIDLLTLAAYQALHRLAGAERLLDAHWPAAVEAVLTQQIREPAIEAQLRAAMPQQTAIEDATSLKVEAQYVENPYPRWVTPEIALPPRSVTGYLREIFPQSPFQAPDQGNGADVLVAGCGTGNQSIGAARRFRNSRVLAIDLSLSSLGYAARKSQELGIDQIDYAQADILLLGGIERRFDVIESAGVLHHLADPGAGLRALLRLLRPGGFLQLGLYSQVARREITQARQYIREHGYGASAEEIRRCRQDLLALDPAAHPALHAVTRLADFYSTSACRDLLFHVHEICMTMADIERLISDHGLHFLGFDLDPAVRQGYATRYPDDPAGINFGHWAEFEAEHPDTFIGMYQFWAQKPA